MIWNLDKFREIEAEPMPTGSMESQGLELLSRCEKRDKWLEQMAIESERDGDSEGAWLAMATRAENKRFMEAIRARMERDNSQ